MRQSRGGEEFITTPAREPDCLRASGSAQEVQTCFGCHFPVGEDLALGGSNPALLLTPELAI